MISYKTTGRYFCLDYKWLHIHKTVNDSQHESNSFECFD